MKDKKIAVLPASTTPSLIDLRKDSREFWQSDEPMHERRIDLTLDALWESVRNIVQHLDGLDKRWDEDFTGLAHEFPVLTNLSCPFHPAHLQGLEEMKMYRQQLEGLRDKHEREHESAKQKLWDEYMSDLDDDDFDEDQEIRSY